ncbi:PIR protein [Plasmodium ovale]|uniref:PIR protein n=1 Tax=Plasmodium ovale TaxID=36330 RepID=A0A1D3JEU2_PLAOA|nr:PIR protein [Plasmodium ovale]
MDEWGKILKGLSNYELYNKLNQNDDDKGNYVSFCRIVGHYIQKYPGILEFCYIFAKNLIKLPKVLSDVTDKDERCLYFNFWITDYVRKLLENEWKGKGTENHILTRFLQVENAIKSDSKNNNCLFYYDSNISLNLWKEWKALHDYIENYNDIKEKIKSGGEICTIYSNYFDFIEGLYKKFKGDCCNGHSHKCTNYIILDHWCTKASLFTKLDCDQTKKVTPHYQGLTTNPGTENHQKGDSPPLASSLSLQHEDEEPDNLFSDNSEYYVKLSISLSLFGIFSTLFYMYKFTRFGTCIQSKFSRSKININLDKDTQNLLSHDSDNKELNMYGDDYNINYYPS